MRLAEYLKPEHLFKGKKERKIERKTVGRTGRKAERNKEERSEGRDGRKGRKKDRKTAKKERKGLGKVIDEVRQ